MSTTWVAMPSVSSCLAAWMPSQVAGSLMSTLSCLTPFALNSASRLWARSRRAAAGQHEPCQPVELGRLLGSCCRHVLTSCVAQRHSRSTASQHIQRRAPRHTQVRPLLRYAMLFKGSIACFSKAIAGQHP